MVDDLGNRIDVAQEHVGNVNTRMKVRFTYTTTAVYCTAVPWHIGRVSWCAGFCYAPAVSFNVLLTRCQESVSRFLVMLVST